MTESESYQRLRRGLSDIQSGLTELMSLLSTDEIIKGDKEPDATERAEQARYDFFEQIAEDPLLPESEDLYRKVLTIITDMGYASTLVLQTQLEIDYRQACSIVADLERDGLVEPAHGFRPHKALPIAYELRERLDEELNCISR